MRAVLDGQKKYGEGGKADADVTDSAFGVSEIDPYLAPGETDRLETALKEGGANHTVEIYPGLHHGFAVPGLPIYDRDASERHWERLLALFKRNLPTA